jgi:protocatechuate 3,4-dioxygenase beta subunit
MRILLLIPLTTLAFTQALSSQPADKGRIEGILVNQINNQPLRKGTISLRIAVTTPQPTGTGVPNTPAPSAYSVLSDVEGRFIFDHVDPGQYTMQADRQGFIRATYRSSNGAFINVGPGQVIGNLRFAIVPQGVIAGRVVDEDGDPVTEARVHALRWNTFNGVRRLGYGGPDIPVDDQGNFRIGNLPAAHYALGAELTRMPPPNPDKIHEAYLTTYYPNALNASEATLIPLGAGAEIANVEIRLRKATVFRVRGKIIDTAGAPVRNMALSLSSKSNAANSSYLGRSLTISRDGTFEFSNVLPGSYFIEASHNVMFGGGDQNESGTNKRLFGRHAVTVSKEDVKDVVVSLNAGATITGVVAGENCSTESTANESAAKPDSKTTPAIRLIAVDNSTLRPFSSNCNEEGKFELHDLAPERYRVNLSGTADGNYIKSVRFGNDDITYGILDLTESGSGTLDIKLAPNAATVSGTVHNDKGEVVGDVLVTIGLASIELANQTLFMAHARTNPHGEFTIKNLAPGEYRIQAWEDVDQQLATLPEFRASFDSSSPLVKLSAGSKETLDLKQLSRDAIEVEAAKFR